jgi:hypothetical protein
VKTVMSLVIPKRSGSLLSSQATVGFSRWTLLCLVICNVTRNKVMDERNLILIFSLKARHEKFCVQMVISEPKNTL